MSVVDSYIHQIEKYSQVGLDLCLSVDFIYNRFLIHEIDAAHKLVVDNYYFRARNLDLFCTFCCLVDTERLGGIQKIRQQIYYPST